MKRWWGWIAALSLAACDRPNEATKPAPAAASAVVPPAPASPADDAKAIVRNRCASCHGSGGKGQ